jgi:hypothetical protein
LWRELLLMIHQLCPTTFFITFTSVETKWFLLFHSLYDLNQKIKIADIPFDRLEPKHIIQCELVTCLHYYDHRMQSFAKLLLKDTIFKFVLDYFFIIEFQNHGNKHDHQLLLISNPPIYGSQTNKETKEFINKYM